MDTPEGERVSTGSFRLEIGRALEKLRAYRDPKAGPLVFWVRCASASRASFLHLEERWRHLTMAFDGAPLPKAALEDPYGALFTEGAPQSLVQFARGMLHAWPAVAGLEVESGPPGDRRTLSAQAPDQLRVSRGGAGSGTIFRLAVKDAERLWGHPKPLSSVVCAPRTHLWTPFPIEFKEGRKALRRYERAKPRFGELEFEEDGVYGRLSIPPARLEALAVDVHYLGVLVDRVVEPQASVPAVGKLDAPDLKLDLTHAAIVHTPRLLAIRQLCGRYADELLARVCRDLKERMPETARIVKRSRLARRAWHRAVTLEPSRPKEGPWARLLEAVGLRPRSDELRHVLDDAAACLWVRRTAGRRMAKGQPLGELAEVPVILTQGLEPMSTGAFAAAYGHDIAELLRENG